MSSLWFTNSGTLAAGQSALFSIGGNTLNLVNGATITTTAAAGAPFGVNTDGDTIGTAVTVASGTSFVFTNSNHNLTFSGNISGAGALNFDGLGTTVQYTFLSGSNSYAGGTTIDGGYVQTANRTTNGANNFAFGTGS